MLGYYLNLSLEFLIKIISIWGIQILITLLVLTVIRFITKDNSIIIKLLVKISRL